MADPITTFPVPTKNIMELDDADPGGSNHLYAEVVQDGNSRKVEIVPRTNAILDGAPVASTPPPEATGNEIATAEWTIERLDELDLTPDSPGEPTNGAVILRTALDQDGKVIIFAVVSWDAPVPVRPAWNYEVRYTKDGIDPDSKMTGEPGAKIRVESGTEYVFKIRTTGKDNKSDWLELAPITPVKKMIAPPAPSGLVRVNGHRRVKLKWDNPLIANPTFYDYAKTIIYRAPNNNFANAVEIDRVNGTFYIDDGLDNGTTWYYWITHLDSSRNEGAKHPTSNTAGVQGQPTRLTDDDTDSTAPGKPTSLLVTPRTRMSDDGRLILEAIVTFSPPSGGLSSKGEYVVWCRNMTTGDAASTQVTDRDDRSVTFRVNDLTTYNFKVRAKQGSGQAGEWSDPVILVTDRKASYGAAASGLTAFGGHKRVRLNWAALTGTDLIDYRRTFVYRATDNDFSNAQVIGRPDGTEFIDDNLTNGNDYWYWIAHQDNSRNLGPRFPAGPATNNGIHALTSRIVRNDITDLAVDTDQMEYHSISAADRFNISMTMVAHVQSDENPAPTFGWGGDEAGEKKGFGGDGKGVVCGKSEKVRNHNPTPVRISGTMSLIMKAKDSSSPADGKTEVFAHLKLEFRKWAETDNNENAWKPVPRFKGPGVKTAARGSKDISGDTKKNVAISCVHRVKDADTYQYRVKLGGFHRRGSGRDWILMDISMDCHLTMQYTRR